MQTIRILFYSDTHAIDLDPDAKWSVFDVEKFIKFKTKGLARVQICLINRHPIDLDTGDLIYGGNKLTRKLLSNYDELWVFNKAPINLPHNGPQYLNIELTKKEVKVLREWMDGGGGVLMTGDHAKRHPITDSDDHRTYLTLGRALGYKIPRARRLRVWEGPPTAEIDGILLPDRDNYNTQEGDDLEQLESSGLQSDGKPQTLIIDSPEMPHQLLWWRVDDGNLIVPILAFPDHGHEGALILPDKLDREWPKDSPPPQVVAWGKDKRFADKFYRLVIAYDGDTVGIGRIVADSSFHHYVKPNLIGIPSRDRNGDPEPNSCLDQIAQFYGNLALWLAPKRIRDKIKKDLYFSLAQHPDVFEVEGTSARVVGNAARFALESEIGKSNLYRLLALSSEEEEFEGMDKLHFLALIGKKAAFELSTSEQESFLGGIIQRYHEAFNSEGIIDPIALEKNPIPASLTGNVVAQAFLAQKSLIERLAAESEEQLQDLLLRLKHL